VNSSIISSPAPGSFVHLSHVGINAEGIIETSKDIDPAWQILIQDLQTYGVSRDVVADNVDFVEGFLAGANVAKAKAVGSKVVNADPTSVKRMPLLVRLILFAHHMHPASEKRRLFRKKPPIQ
jgi:Wiskott-Aldrich syndrome protein